MLGYSAHIADNFFRLGKNVVIYPLYQIGSSAVGIIGMNGIGVVYISAFDHVIPEKSSLKPEGAAYLLEG